MTDNQGAGSQAGQQGGGTGAPTNQGTGQQGQQSLGDQVFGAQGQQGDQTGADNQGLTFEGMKQGETVAQYVARLNQDLTKTRQEAGRYRTQLRSVAGDDQVGEDGLTEFQRVQRQVEKLNQDLTNERNQRKADKTSAALISALAEQGAVSPARAALLIQPSELQIADDGTPEPEALAAAITKIKTELPGIFTDRRGNGDGGAGNLNGTEPSNFNDLIRARAGVRAS